MRPLKSKGQVPGMPFALCVDTTEEGMRLMDHDRGDEDGFDFSFRPGYGERLFVHVPEATLVVLRQKAGSTITALSLLNRYSVAICALAAVKCKIQKTTSVVVTEADAESILASTGSGDFRLRPTE